METLKVVLPWTQIILSVVLILAVLLQQSSGALGAAFGDSSGGRIYAKRGFERTLLMGTVALSVAFVASTVAALFV